MSKKLVASAALVAAGVATWGLIETRLFKLRREKIGILPQGSSPIRVLHISDIHMAPWQKAKRDWISRLGRLKPDLVVVTGDFMGHRDGLENIKAALSPLAGIPGFYVFGSNDYYAPEPKNPFRYLVANSEPSSKEERIDTDSLKDFLADLGWQNLNNAVGSAVIPIRSENSKQAVNLRIDAIGTADAHRNWDRLDQLTTELEKLQEGDETGTQYRELEDKQDSSSLTLTIGVTHAPYVRVLDTLTTLGAEIIFAGHTHGGQVRIPGLPPLVTNADLPREQAHGLSVWERAGKMSFLNVSAGLGTSIYAPVRFACPPEVSLIELVTVD